MGHGQSVVVRDPATGLGANVNASGKLEVDTEISLSGDVTIENLKVGKDDAGALKYLRVDGSRNLYAVLISGDSHVQLWDGTNEVGVTANRVDVNLPSGDDIIGRVRSQGASYIPIRKTGNWSGAQTDTAVWTPAAGKRIHLHGVMVSTDDANNIELESANVDVVPPMYLAGSGGAVVSGMGEIWMGSGDAILTLTSTVATNHSVLAWGYEE